METARNAVEDNLQDYTAQLKERIAELEQRMAQYGDVEPATEADVSGKLENLQMARSFRDSLEFCVIVYDKIEKW